LNNSCVSVTDCNSYFGSGWGSDFPLTYREQEHPTSVQATEFIESDLGKIFLKYATKAVKKGYTQEGSVAELLKNLTESNKKGMCHGYATSILLSQKRCQDARNIQTGLTTEATQVIFFQAIHIFHLHMIKHTVRELDPIEKAIDQRELDFTEQKQERDRLNTEVEKRAKFFEKIKKIELAQIKRLSSLALIGEEEIEMSSKLLEKFENVFQEKRVTALRIGFNHQKDGHAICINLLPTPIIYDSNVGVIPCGDTLNTKRRLFQYIQYLLKDTANPLNCVTIEKFSGPIEEEIDIVN
jgi:hypothetical protein